MMQPRRMASCLALAVVAASLQLAAPTACRAQSLSLQGPDGAKAEVSAVELAALPHVPVLLNGHAPASYEGVPLAMLLAKVGAASCNEAATTAKARQEAIRRGCIIELSYCCMTNLQQ